MKKVGILKRATIMGGESTLIENLPDFIELCKKYVMDLSFLLLYFKVKCFNDCIELAKVMLRS